MKGRYKEKICMVRQCRPRWVIDNRVKELCHFVIARVAILTEAHVV